MKSQNYNKGMLLKKIKSLTVHDHLCLIYETREEQFAAAMPFMKICLERGEQCIYVVDENIAETVLKALQDEGLNADSFLKSGALKIITKKEAYLKQGYFDPDWMIRFLTEATHCAKADGYSALRVTGEMTWVLGGEPGVERIMEYEAKLNYFFPNHDALAVCQYNFNRFSPEIVRDVIYTHPWVIFGGLVCKNYYYVPPKEFLKPNQTGLEVNRLLHNILSREQAEDTLRKVNQMLKTLSSANQILVHATEESELLNKVCQILVEIGGCHLAWTGFVEGGKKKTLRLVARAGCKEKLQDIGNINWLDTKYRRAPIARAIRTGKPCASRNILADPEYALWHADARKLGCASSISLPLIADGKTIGVLNVYAKEPDAFDSEDVKTLTELADDLAYGIMAIRMRVEHMQAREELKQSYDKLRKSLEGTVKAIASLVEKRDPYTSGHQQRVTLLVCAIAEEMGLSNDQIDGSYLAGLLHDVGKIAVPAEILSKPSSLTEAEFSIVKTHPQVAYDILKAVAFPWPIAQIVLQHHEKMNGSGYPHGTLGDDILLEAKILTVADVVEAMSSHRPYRPALGIDAALSEISKNSGVLYAPEVVDACLKVIKEKGFTFD
ncbi:MAG: MEDS domain-containing protein [bacterium]